MLVWQFGFVGALKIDGLFADMFFLVSVCFCFRYQFFRALAREVDAAQLHDITICPSKLTAMCLIPRLSLAGRRDQNPDIT
jgi:hypothetical protein